MVDVFGERGGGGDICFSGRKTSGLSESDIEILKNNVDSMMLCAYGMLPYIKSCM